VKKISKVFQVACAWAGIKVATRMYDLQHLFTTTMLRKRVDLAAISKLMGRS